MTIFASASYYPFYALLTYPIDCNFPSERPLSERLDIPFNFDGPVNSLEVLIRNHFISSYKTFYGELWAYLTLTNSQLEAIRLVYSVCADLDNLSTLIGLPSTVLKDDVRIVLLELQKAYHEKTYKAVQELKALVTSQQWEELLKNYVSTQTQVVIPKLPLRFLSTKIEKVCEAADLDFEHFLKIAQPDPQADFITHRLVISQMNSYVNSLLHDVPLIEDYLVTQLAHINRLDRTIQTVKARLLQNKRDEKDLGKFDHLRQFLAALQREVIDLYRGFLSEESLINLGLLEESGTRFRKLTWSGTPAEFGVVFLSLVHQGKIQINGQANLSSISKSLAKMFNVKKKGKEDFLEDASTENLIKNDLTNQSLKSALNTDLVKVPKVVASPKV